MLELKGIRQVFRSGQDEVVALDRIDLHLDRGDFLSIIGSNGAGKSTLLGVIAGVLVPTAGQVLIGGEDLTTTPAWRRARRIGRIVQNPLSGTAPTMTIAENMALALKRSGRSFVPAITKRRRRLFGEELSPLGMGLEHRLDVPAYLLSGGERQALTVTMATLAEPDILLLDEHTAALDPANARLIADLTEAHVKRTRLVTLAVTHNMEQAIRLGNRLIMMHKGAIILSLEGKEKRGTSVGRLVELFARRHIVDDALLLEAPA